MNVHELAEITALLSRRGLADQCRIRLSNIRNATMHNGSPMSRQVAIIYHGGKRFATIARFSDGTCRARRSGYNSYYGHNSYYGNSEAEALDNLLDNQP